jgi:hypothetical protein
VETGGNKEDGTVNIFTSRELNAVLVLVSLAEQESNTKQNGEE